MQDWTPNPPDCPKCAHPMIVRAAGPECPLCTDEYTPTHANSDKQSHLEEGEPCEGFQHLMDQLNSRPDGAPATPQGDPSATRHELRGTVKVIPELTPDGLCHAGQATRKPEARVHRDTASGISNAAKSRKT